MRILATDIGGTNSRFVHFQGEILHPGDLNHYFSFSTNAVDSFPELLETYEENRPDGFLAIKEYDVLVISAAGPVTGTSCRPPNIEWEIDISRVDHPRCMLINDFVAQSYACLIDEIKADFTVVKPGSDRQYGVIAIIGAGTGLGHCALLDHVNPVNGNREYLPVASEGGHAQFPFSGSDEMKLQSFVQNKLNVPYAENEFVVSGRGLSLVHEFLTGEQLRPEDIAGQFDKYQDTLSWYAKFYARACRNYCLSVFASGGLIVSGGIAAKNPGIVLHASFIEEFVLSPAHSLFLESIPVYLNSNENIGLLGAVNYGMCQVNI